MAKATHFFCMTAVKDLPYFNKPQKTLHCNPVTSFQATKVSHLKLSVSLCTESSKGCEHTKTNRKKRTQNVTNACSDESVQLVAISNEACDNIKNICYINTAASLRAE
jgi:hypothetical protein